MLESSCNPQEPKPRICYPTQFGVFGLQSLEWQLGAAEERAHMYTQTHVFVYLVFLCTCVVFNRRFEYSKEVFMQYIRYIYVWPIWSAHCTVLSDGSRVHGSAQLRGRE